MLPSPESFQFKLTSIDFEKVRLLLLSALMKINNIFNLLQLPVAKLVSGIEDFSFYLKDSIKRSIWLCSESKPSLLIIMRVRKYCFHSFQH